MKKILHFFQWMSPFQGPQVYDHRQRSIPTTVLAGVFTLAALGLALTGIICWIMT